MVVSGGIFMLGISFAYSRPKKLKNSLSGVIFKTPSPNLKGELSFAKKLTLSSQISQSFVRPWNIWVC